MRYEFDSQYTLIKMFNLDEKLLFKTKAKLSSIILNATPCLNHQLRDVNIFHLDLHNIHLTKYNYIKEWYENPENHNYNKKLLTNVAGLEHIFSWGGLHGGKKQYEYSNKELPLLNIDVVSYYPSIIINHGCLSRYVQTPNLYKEIFHKRVSLKKNHDKQEKSLKIVLNSTYGAMKDVYNSLYDPQKANNICVLGQLFLLMLIEKLEPYIELIQSNTDGILIRPLNKKNIKIIKNMLKEFSDITKFEFETQEIEYLMQRDVNTYLARFTDGSIKGKGFLKLPTSLDCDIAIIRVALIEYFLKKTPLEKTIHNISYPLTYYCKLIKKGAYDAIVDEENKPLEQKINRLIATKRGKTLRFLKNNKVRLIPNCPEKGILLNHVNTNISLSSYKQLDNIDFSYYLDQCKKNYELITGNQYGMCQTTLDTF